jgi:hypothetical protein
VAKPTEIKVAEESVKEVVKEFQAQTLKDHEPQGSEAEMRAAAMDMEKFGCCARARMGTGVEKSERTRGCAMYEFCTLTQIKGKGRPVNLPFRLYKRAGTREGYGPCFSVFRMGGQYNGQDTNFIMEILPVGTKINMPKSVMIRSADGQERWEDQMVEVSVPPFPKLGSGGFHVHDQRAKVREGLMQARRQAVMENTMGIVGDAEPDQG